MAQARGEARVQDWDLRPRTSVPLGVSCMELQAESHFNVRAQVARQLDNALAPESRRAAPKWPSFRLVEHPSRHSQPLVEEPSDCAVLATCPGASPWPSRLLDPVGLQQGLKPDCTSSSQTAQAQARVLKCLPEGASKRGCKCGSASGCRVSGGGYPSPAGQQAGRAAAPRLDSRPTSTHCITTKAHHHVDKDDSALLAPLTAMGITAPPHPPTHPSLLHSIVCGCTPCSRRNYQSKLPGLTPLPIPSPPLLSHCLTASPPPACPRAADSGRPRGFGFVEFIDIREAEDAIYHLDKTLFGGREITVRAAVRTHRQLSPPVVGARRFCAQRPAGNATDRACALHNMHGSSWLQPRGVHARCAPEFAALAPTTPAPRAAPRRRC